MNFSGFAIRSQLGSNWLNDLICIEFSTLPLGHHTSLENCYWYMFLILLDMFDQLTLIINTSSYAGEELHCLLFLRWIHLRERKTRLWEKTNCQITVQRQTKTVHQTKQSASAMKQKLLEEWWSGHLSERLELIVLCMLWLAISEGQIFCKPTGIIGWLSTVIEL